MFESAEGLQMAVRTAHFASSVGLFGEFVFFLLIAGPFEKRRLLSASGHAAPRQRLLMVAAAWVFVVIASGALWFDIEAAAMSGLSLGGTLNRETLGLVLTQTLFGQVWMLRLCLALILIAALVAARLRVPGHSWIVFGTCVVLAGAMLATLAWAGHANAEKGTDRLVHRTVDVLHLLAAGAWLGALAPLAAILSRSGQGEDVEALDASAHAAKRFSTLGIICVSTLAATGIVNAWYTVGNVSALIETYYGRLLLLKLCLFAFMIALAAFNRSRLTPMLRATTASTIERASAALRLRRNAAIEAASGFAILGVVGVLGIAMPAMHR